MSLYEIRLTLGISQNKLAKQIGCDQGTLSRWESGEVPITEERAEAVAKALDIPTYLILDTWPEKITTLGDLYYWLIKSLKSGALQLTGERDSFGRLKKGTLSFMGIQYPDTPRVDEFLDWEVAWRENNYQEFRKAISLCLIKDPLYIEHPKVQKTDTRLELY